MPFTRHLDIFQVHFDNDVQVNVMKKTIYVNQIYNSLENLI